MASNPFRRVGAGVVKALDERHTEGAAPRGKAKSRRPAAKAKPKAAPKAKARAKPARRAAR